MCGVEGGGVVAAGSMGDPAAVLNLPLCFYLRDFGKYPRCVLEKKGLLKKRIVAAVIMAIALPLFVLAVPTFAVGAHTVPRGIWADGRLFGTVFSTNNVPDEGYFNTLYSFEQSGLEGQRSVSNAKPGDHDYCGGRWKIFPVTFTASGISVHDPDYDDTVNFELTSEAELLTCAAMGYIVISAEPIGRFSSRLFQKAKSKP